VSSHLQALQEAAQAQGVQLSVYRVAKPEEISPAIAAAKAAGADALNALASPFLRANEQLIRDCTAALKLPAIYQFPEMAEAGGLAGYGPRMDEIYRTVQARQLVILLNGAKPAELPIEQPTRLVLIINLKTAKALGPTVPPNILDLADEIIE
jgi:putative tryptophan/tyrosine transport system substrate-binding protein